MFFGLFDIGLYCFPEILNFLDLVSIIRIDLLKRDENEKGKKNDEKVENESVKKLDVNNIHN